MKMTLCLRRMGLLVLAGSVLLTWPLSSPAQVSALNSLVARVDQPRGPVPAECEQGLSPTPPLRVEVRDIELPASEPAEAIAPPSGALRDALQETQAALTRNDRPAFNAALARTKALLMTYPAGAERRTAEDIVRLHETAARLWDAQYETPFFSQTDPEYALVSGLPGYAEAVRRGTLTDDRERRFYPTAESRDFVAQVAGERLQRLGIRGGTRSIRDDRDRAERPRTTRASAQASPRRSTASTSPRRPTASSSPSRASTPTRKPAAATPAPRSPNPTAPPTVAAAPAPASATSSTTTSPSSSSPAAGDVSTSAAPAPAPVTTASDAATTTTLPSSEPATTDPTTATTASMPAGTSTDVVPGTPPATRGRTVFLPVVLILIGLGVLIVLFRASK